MTRFRTWTPGRLWRHRSPRCPIRPRGWLRNDGLRFRASSGRPFRTWLATSQSGFQCSSPVADHRELDGKDPRALREHVYFSAEDRRRATVGLVKRGSVSDVSAGDSPLLAKVLGRLQFVVASLVSVTNSSDGERAAEDVEERLQAIEASLRGFQANP